MGGRGRSQFGNMQVGGMSGRRGQRESGGGGGVREERGEKGMRRE